MPTVAIEKPADEPLGVWFETLRGWLDRNGCSGVTFARVGQGSDRLVYRLVFRDGALAEKFSRTFAAYLTEAPHTQMDNVPGFAVFDGLGDAPA